MNNSQALTLVSCNLIPLLPALTFNVILCDREVYHVLGTLDLAANLLQALLLTPFVDEPEIE